MTTENATDADVFAAYPGVLIDRDSIDHYRGLMSGKLLINRCQDCGYWIYPHRPMCPECLSISVTPTEVSGKGRVYMFTLLRLQRDKTDAPPMLTAAIELAEQPCLRYLSLIDCPPEEVRYDMPVKLIWMMRDGRVWPAFAPDDVAEG